MANYMILVFIASCLICCFSLTLLFDSVRLNKKCRKILNDVIAHELKSKYFLDESERIYKEAGTHLDNCNKILKDAQKYEIVQSIIPSDGVQKH